MGISSGVPIGVVGLVFFEIYIPPGGPPEPGRERFVSEVPTALGGAINTASVVQALGHPARLYYPDGEGLIAAAVRYGIEETGLTAMTWPAHRASAVSLVYSADGDRAFVSEAHYEALRSCPAFHKHEWMHVAGLAEAHALRDQLTEARNRGTKVSVAGSWSPTHLDTLADLRNQPWDLLILNRDEALRVAGHLDSALERLGGAAHDVIVTAGADGAVARIGGQRLEVDGEPVDAVDTTGAGDAFIGGYLAAQCEGRPARESLRIATRVAAHQLGVRGGVLANREGITALRGAL